VYGILDVLGDFGGIQYVFLLFGQFLFTPLAEFNYSMKAISKLYLARTKDRYLFHDSKNPKIVRKLEKLKEKSKNDPKLREAIKMNHVIKFTFRQLATVFLLKFLPCLKRDKNKLWRLYEEGTDRISKNLDLVKMYNSLRKMKIMLKEFHDHSQFQSSDKMFIDLDSDHGGEKEVNVFE
jgi:hypothetical protein